APATKALKCFTSSKVAAKPEGTRNEGTVIDRELIGATEIATLKAHVLGSCPFISRLANGRDLPRLRQARLSERVAHSARSAKRLCGQQTGANGRYTGKTGTNQE